MKAKTGFGAGTRVSIGVVGWLMSGLLSVQAIRPGVQEMPLKTVETASAIAPSQEAAEASFIFSRFFYTPNTYEMYWDHYPIKSEEDGIPAEQVRQATTGYAEFSIPQSGGLLLYVTDRKNLQPDRGEEPRIVLEQWDEDRQDWQATSQPMYQDGSIPGITDPSDLTKPNPCWRRYEGPRKFRIVASAARNFDGRMIFKSTIRCRVLFHPDIDLESLEIGGRVVRLIGKGRLSLVDKQGRVLKWLRAGDEVPRGILIQTDGSQLARIMIGNPDGQPVYVNVNPNTQVRLKVPMPNEPLISMSFGRLLNWLIPLNGISEYQSEEYDGVVAGVSEPGDSLDQPAPDLSLFSPEERRKYYELEAQAIKLAEKAYQVETPNAIAGSDGTVFEVQYDAKDRATRVRVQESRVVVRPRQPERTGIRLAAGQQIIIRNQGMEPVGPIPADEWACLTAEAEELKGAANDSGY